MKRLFFIIALFSQSILYSQPEPINAEHPVYFFLRKAAVTGFIPEYDDAIIPKSRTEITENLKILESRKSELTTAMQEELERYFLAFSIKTTDNTNPAEEPNRISALFSSPKEAHLFKHNETGFEATLDPLLAIKYHETHDPNYNEKRAGYFRYGAYIRFNYSDWFSAYIMAWNGNSYGSRQLNGSDPTVGQKFTFWHTGLDHFDGTEGGAFVKKGIFSASIVRNRTLWGENFYLKDKISGASQMFDRFEFEIKTGFFTYNFMHGTLVTPQYITPGDTMYGDPKHRDEKYTAQNRLSFQISNSFRLSLWQAVIYAGRSIEPAYLNPFLFWESAQRSLQDLDNSLIGLDVRYRPAAGVELTGSVIFDDINFSNWLPGKFQKNSNRMSFLAGLMYIPQFAPRLTFNLSYYFVRPYTFSHPGDGENLAYVNNHFPLGLDVQPNSDMWNLRVDWQIMAQWRMSFDLKHIRNGANMYDHLGNMTENHGGSFFVPINKLSKEDAYFLAGDLHNTTSFDIVTEYALSANVRVNAGINSRSRNFSEPTIPSSYYYCSVSLFYF